VDELDAPEGLQASTMGAKDQVCDLGLTGCATRHSSCSASPAFSGAPNLAGVWREHLTFTCEGTGLMIPSGRAIRSIGILKGRSETCPVRAMETWLRVSRCEFGPVFGKVNVWGTVEQDSLPSHSVSMIFRNRVEKAGGSGSALSSEFHWATRRVRSRRVHGRGRD
jgi:hypothetical protein